MSKSTAVNNETIQPSPVRVFGRDQFLAQAPVLDTVQVPIPEFGEGVVVNVRAMSAGDRDRFEESMKKGKGKNTTIDLRNFRARLCIASIVDETGAKVFSGIDLPALSAYPVKILQRICQAATEASGLDDDDEDGDDPLDDSGETSANEPAIA